MRTKRPADRGARDQGPGRTARAVLGVLVLLSAAAAYGQTDRPRAIWGGAFGGFMPAGEFRDRIDKMGIGLDLFYGWRLRNSPIFVGGEFTAQEIGHSLLADVDSYNGILQLLAFVRVRPPTGAVVTYLEGLAGASYVTTETDYGFDEYGDPITETDSDDVVFAAGVGAGLSFRIGGRGTGAEPPRRGVYIDLGVRYMTGGRANYLVVLPDESFLPESSRTNFFTAKVGLSYLF